MRQRISCACYAESTELQEARSDDTLRSPRRIEEYADAGHWCRGGRTTRHFAAAVREYVGIDYSDRMIESCEQQKSLFPNNVSFRVCDVRDMAIWKDGSFDFVLFSFNGIDYLSYADRLRAFQEMRRVTRIGGIGCFSTHNIRSLVGWPPLPRLSANPAELGRRSLRYLRHLFRNMRLKDLCNEKYAIINDGAYCSRFETHYILPREQLNQLAECGFGNTRVFSLRSGAELRIDSGLNALKDAWLYYLCRATQ